MRCTESFVGNAFAASQYRFSIIPRQTTVVLCHIHVCSFLGLKRFFHVVSLLWAIITFLFVSISLYSLVYYCLLKQRLISTTMFAALNLNFISPDCYSECSDVESLCTFCEIYITSRQSVFTNFCGKEDEFRIRTTTTDNERISMKRAKMSFLFISLGFFVPFENYLFTHMETSFLPLKGSLFWSMLDTLWSLSNEGSLAYHTNCDTGYFYKWYSHLLLSDMQWSCHDLCLSQSGFEHTSFQMWGGRS